MMIPGDEALSNLVIGAAIEVHRTLGPGLLESVYEQCIEFELQRLRIAHRRQVLVPVTYKGVRLAAGFRADILLDGLVVEVKSVEKILPLHESQLLSYMRLLDMPAGLLLNFQTPVLKDGIRRLTLRSRAVRGDSM